MVLTYYIVGVFGYFSDIAASGRHRREEAASNDIQQPLNSWVTVVLSVAMIVLMLLILVMCVGGSKHSPPPSTTKLVHCFSPLVITLLLFSIPGNLANKVSIIYICYDILYVTYC